jgi:hypothetical protein
LCDPAFAGFFGGRLIFTKQHALSFKIALYAVGAVAVLAGLSFLYGTPQAVIIANRAHEPIAGGSIEVDTQRLTFADLQPGETRRLPFRMHAASDYAMVVTLESGKTITANVGYAGSGFETDTIEISDTAMSQTQATVAKRPAACWLFKLSCPEPP